MEHPNIAKVFDAGATDTGRPFFVMELVRGIRITDYCDQNQLSTIERLDLFIQVCHAIQHAHQKGIIHRDIKPSNILVAQHDTVAVPKVIDFGIAKATSDQQLTDKTLFTAFEQFMGTPAYMSPEQAQLSGLDIDTRTDIYSLGVLLYELLTGQTPFDARELIASGLDAMRKTICEKDPVRPSTRLRQTLPGSTSSSKLTTDHWSLATDLDWIVMKCLEKDRSRRYETANGLATDLKRHLGNEPVIARPPSMAYRIGKLVRRNKLAFAAAVAVTISLVLGASVSTWQAIQAGRARDAEKQERQRAESGERVARHIAYASVMNLAQQAVKADEFFQALRLLDRYRPEGKSKIQNPKPNMEIEEDLRGWEWRYLWRQCHRGGQRFVLGEHTGGSNVVGMLADRKTVFSAGRDKFVRLWDLESRRQLDPLPHPEPVFDATASPDGRWLATGTKKNAEGQPVLLWDLATQKPVILTSEFWLNPGSMSFSTDSKWLTFATVRGGVRIWDVTARSDVTNLRPFPPSTVLRGVAFSPVGSTMAYNDNEDGTIVLWDLASRSVIGQLTGHSGGVAILTFSGDGKMLASGGHDRTARLWNIAERREKFPFSRPRGRFKNLKFSPDGRTLAMSVWGGSGSVIRLVDAETGEQKPGLRGHRKDVTSLAFTEDGKTLLSASDDGTVRVWDPVRGAEEKSDHLIDLNSISSRLSPDGRHLLTAYADQTFSLWDTLHLSEGEPHRLPFANTTMAAVAPGGRLAAFGSSSGEVMLWDAETGQTQSFAQPGMNRIQRLIFSADGRWLAAADNAQPLSQMAAGNEKSTIHVWDVSARKEVRVLSSDGEFPVSLTFSAHGDALMAGFGKGPVKVWPLHGQEDAAAFIGHSVGVGGLASLPDGLTLASAGGSLRFWDVGTRRENAPGLFPRVGAFTCLALSPDARRLAAGESDGRITIWDVASHQEVATLEGHEEPLTQLAFTPDGDHLVSVSEDQLRVWRAASWAEIEASEKEGK